jgi:hypothetical protein
MIFLLYELIERCCFHFEKFVIDCLAGIAKDVDDGAILVERSALASSGSTRNVLYFFCRQLPGAHAIQYPVLLGLLQHILLLSSEITFLTLCMMKPKNLGRCREPHGC